MKLVGPVTFGRDPGQTVHLADDEVSRLHATIRLDGAMVVIEDHGSTNGTFVDGARISGVMTLLGGETISIGESRFEVEVLPELAAVGAATTVGRASAPTEISRRPTLRPERPRSDGPSRPAAPASEPAVAAPPFGTFAAAPARARRGVASRELAPSLLSFATIIATAVGLVAYFFERAS